MTKNLVIQLISEKLVKLNLSQNKIEEEDDDLDEVLEEDIDLKKMKEEEDDEEEKMKFLNFNLNLMSIVMS